jgi:two-component system response regulator FixJ
VREAPNPDLIDPLKKRVSMTVPGVHCPPEQTHGAICIVDDDECVADSLKVLLEAFGFVARAYSSGADFLADDRRRRAGCLVIDQHMPGMSGLDVVCHLRSEGLQLPTILISGRLDTNTRERAVRLGVTRILDKPFAADHLIGLIRTTLPGRH